MELGHLVSFGYLSSVGRRTDEAPPTVAPARRMLRVIKGRMICKRKGALPYSDLLAAWKPEFSSYSSKIVMVIIVLLERIIQRLHLIHRASPFLACGIAPFRLVDMDDCFAWHF